MDNLLSGLLGAVIGGFMGGIVALVAAGRQIRASQGLQRREELRSVIAQFWGACDAYWEAQQDLGWAIYQLQLQHQTKDYSGKDQFQEQRMTAFAAKDRADQAVRRAMALMRLSFPALVPSAERLRTSSGEFRILLEGGDVGGEYTATRARALEDFEQAASRELEQPVTR